MCSWASESKPFYSCYSRLSQAQRTAEPIRIPSAVSNWFRRCTSHELYTLNSIRPVTLDAASAQKIAIISGIRVSSAVLCPWLSRIISVPYVKVGANYTDFEPREHKAALKPLRTLGHVFKKPKNSSKEMYTTWVAVPVIYTGESNWSWRFWGTEHNPGTYVQDWMLTRFKFLMLTQT